MYSLVACQERKEYMKSVLFISKLKSWFCKNNASWWFLIMWYDYCKLGRILEFKNTCFPIPQLPFIHFRPIPKQWWLLQLLLPLPPHHQLHLPPHEACKAFWSLGFSELTSLIWVVLQLHQRAFFKPHLTLMPFSSKWWSMAMAVVAKCKLISSGSIRINMTKNIQKHDQLVRYLNFCNPT